MVLERDALYVLKEERILGENFEGHILRTGETIIFERDVELVIIKYTVSKIGNVEGSSLHEFINHFEVLLNDAVDKTFRNEEGLGVRIETT